MIDVDVHVDFILLIFEPIISSIPVQDDSPLLLIYDTYIYEIYIPFKRVFI